LEKTHSFCHEFKRLENNKSKFALKFLLKLILGETGKQVLKQLNSNPLVSRIILVGRRLLEVDDQPKVTITFQTKLIFIDFDLKVSQSF
jgi:hypothetical protein